jgi:poly(hydroxyalkanoate) depolymerase family esterase
MNFLEGSMHRLVPAAALFFATLAAESFAQGQTVNLNYKVAGVDRQTILYAPSGLGANPPLVYVIHGFNMSGQQEVQLTQMNKVADTAKFIVVYPNALKNGSNQQSWDLSGANDYAYILSLIDTVEGRYHIDRKRVYVSGFSQGGFFSFNLGCRYADVIAAIAPVSGTLNQACTLKRPLPTIFTYGTNEGFDINSFIQTGEKWVQLNGCSPTPKVIRPYPPGNPNSVVTRLEYSGCNAGVEVVIDTVKGGTHEWPMNTQTKINNSVEVWNFVKKFSLPSGSPALPFDGAGGKRGLSAAYANGMVSLRGMDAPASIRILDTRGRLVSAGTAVKGRFGFSGHSSGVYQVLAVAGGKTFRFRFAVP